MKMHKIYSLLLCIIYLLIPNPSQHEIALHIKGFSVVICSGYKGDVSGFICQYDLWDGARK